jgi:hypothetical protein
MALNGDQLNSMLPRNVDQASRPRGRRRRSSASGLGRRTKEHIRRLPRGDALHRLGCLEVRRSIVSPRPFLVMFIGGGGAPARERMEVQLSRTPCFFFNAPLARDRRQHAGFVITTLMVHRSFAKAAPV